VGSSTVAVGERRIAVVHVRLTFDYEGPQRGTNPTDFWIDPANGLVVREEETSSVDQGGVEYHEDMQTELTSLTPAR
jgi:hypothetical protein